MNITILNHFVICLSDLVQIGNLYCCTFGPYSCKNWHSSKVCIGVLMSRYSRGRYMTFVNSLLWTILVYKQM